MPDAIAGKGGGPTPFVNAFHGAKLNSLRYNTSQAGSAMPLAYGTCRVSVNLIELWGFTGSKGGGKGGKGLGSSGGKKGSKQSYSVDVAFALCQGPVSFTGASHGIAGNNRIWSNGGIAAGLAQVGLNGYAGNDGQAADPVFVSGDPNTPVLGYSGTCYVTGTPMQLGSTPALPNLQFEITGCKAGTAGPDFPDDARPDEIVADLLTNPRYGAGFPAANLDTAGALADWGDYCQAAQLAMSLLIDRQQPCARWIEEIAQLTVSAVVWSGSLLKIMPYGDQPLSANGASWAPNLTWQYSLGDDDFLDFGGGSDPVLLSRADAAQTPNWLSIEYMDGVSSYNQQVLPLWDQGLIDRHGLHVDPAIQAHEFTNPVSAAISAQLQLQRRAYIRNTYKFKLGWRYSLLEPMDIVLLTDAALGLQQAAVRITQIDEERRADRHRRGNSGSDPLDARNDHPDRVGTAPLYPRLSTAGDGVDTLADPGDSNPPIIFEPPTALSGGALEVWIIASGGLDWGGCQVWVSSDNATYALAGTIYRGGRQGTLTAALSSHTDPDTVDTLSLDLSQGQLLSGTLADADNFVTLCYCDGELVSYQTATLTALYQYDLTYLRRGVYGTPINAHSVGSNVARFGPNDPSLFRYRYPGNFVGQTIYIKLPGFNIFGQRLQDLSTLTADTYVLTGAGAVATVTVPIQYLGIPQAAQPITRYTFGEAVSFPANLTGSSCTAGAAATAAQIFDIANNGTNYATLSFAAGGTVAGFAGPAQSFISGDVLTITPQATDATLANISGFLAGTS